MNLLNICIKTERITMSTHDEGVGIEGRGAHRAHRLPEEVA